MSWLRSIWLLLLVLGTLVSPRLASAQAPLGLETRVGGLELAAQVIVGVHDLAGAGSYLGNLDGYDENASGCSLAATLAEIPVSLLGLDRIGGDYVTWPHGQDG